MNKKTFKDWSGSKLDFEQFVKPGDQIDKEMYWYFLEVLFPRIMHPKGFLMGEPASHDENNNPTYGAFEDKKGKYFYRGTMTVEQFRKEVLA